MLKRLFKKNTHNLLFKYLAGFGRSINRMYENSEHNMHYNGELELIKKLGKLNPKVIIDAGANKGMYAKYLAEHCPTAQIYAFEPVGSTFEILKEGLDEYSHVHCIQQGLFSESCKKEINIFNSDTHASLVEIQGLNQNFDNKQEIQLVKGEDFIASQGIEEIDFIKMDIEGAEYEAMLGFEEMIKAQKIRMIQFEYGYINITTKVLLMDFYRFFKQKGYIIGKIFPKSVEFRKYEFKYENFLGSNYVAIREDDSELKDLLLS